MQRYLSIDVVRGTAIILMIQVHFVENLSPRDSATGWLYDACLFLGGIPAPLFTFVSGLSYQLWLSKQQAERRPDREITRITLRRGLFVFVVGIAFNFFVWLPEETFNWDVLTLIGTALLVLAYARKLPSPVLCLVCVLIFLVSPLLRVVGDYWAYWENDAYTYDFTVRDILFGFVANGYFPVFPWLLFPLAGFIAGDVVFRRRRSQRSLWRTAALGIGLLILSGLGMVVGSALPSFLAAHYASGFSEFPASTEYVLTTLGITLLSTVLLHRCMDKGARFSREGPFITMLTRYSTFSLTIYIFHHLVILWPLWIYGAAQDFADPTRYWRQAMPTPWALALFALFMVACHFVLLFLQKHRQFTLESLMRRVCDQSSRR